MKEGQFREYVKHWLEREGYVLKSMVFPLDDVPTKDVLKLYREAHRELYSKNKRFFISPHFPEYLFVKKSVGYPDMAGVRSGEAFAFEIKMSLDYEQLDRCVGQCLRYLTGLWMDKIYIIVPKGIENVSILKKIILRFKLPIHVIEINIEKNVNQKNRNL